MEHDMSDKSSHDPLKQAMTGKTIASCAPAIYGELVVRFTDGTGVKIIGDYVDYCEDGIDANLLFELLGKNKS